MQPRVMNHCRIRSEDCGLYRRMPSVGKTPTERDLNDVFEVELHFIGSYSVGESIERLLELGFKIFENVHHFFNSRLVDHTVRSIDEQTNVFMKLNIGREVHCVLIADVPPFDSLASSSIEDDLVASLCGKTPSHCAAPPSS